MAVSSILYVKPQYIMRILIILSVMFGSVAYGCFPCEWLRKKFTSQSTPKHRPLIPITVHCNPKDIDCGTDASLLESPTSSHIHPQPYRQIAKHCARMMDAFPIKETAAKHALFWNLYGVSADYSEIAAFLTLKCIQRFEELNTSMTHMTHSDSDQLMVVDIDALCVHYTLPKNQEIDTFIPHHNQEHLKLNTFDDHVVFYRNGIVQFINIMSRMHCDVGSYTQQSDPFIDTYKAVTTETYYNWFYLVEKLMKRFIKCCHQNTNNTKWKFILQEIKSCHQKAIFKFKFVRQTTHKAQKKSIYGLVGDIQFEDVSYNKIIILDNEASAKWQPIPATFVHATTQTIQPIQIIPIDIGGSNINNQSNISYILQNDDLNVVRNLRIGLQELAKNHQNKHGLAEWIKTQKS
eukprot:227513_1